MLAVNDVGEPCAGKPHAVDMATIRLTDCSRTQWLRAPFGRAGHPQTCSSIFTHLHVAVDRDSPKHGRSTVRGGTAKGEENCHAFMPEIMKRIRGRPAASLVS